MSKSLDQMRYEYALNRVEELLPLVGEDMPATDPLAIDESAFQAGGSGVRFC